MALTINEIDGLSYLESYTYSCKEGYATTDPLTTLCQPDGSLSLTRPPECSGKFFFFNFVMTLCNWWLQNIIGYKPLYPS